MESVILLMVAEKNYNMKSIKVYCIKYAESNLPESMVFDGGSTEKHIPISFAVYLIKCGDKNILIDAGCDTLTSFKMEKFYSPAFVLRQFGLSSNEITDVIITHSHRDHIEAVKHFNNAVIHISNLEYENGKKYIPDNFKTSRFENSFFLTPEIKVIKFDGHSKGSAIVEIKLKDTIHIFAGDECYTNANIENKICTGAFVDKQKAIEFINIYSNKKYHVHTCHDISLKTERIYCPQ